MNEKQLKKDLEKLEKILKDIRKENDKFCDAMQELINSYVTEVAKALNETELITKKGKIK